MSIDVARGCMALRAVGAPRSLCDAMPKAGARPARRRHRAAACQTD
jgi:hypothetical protein